MKRVSIKMSKEHRKVLRYSENMSDKFSEIVRKFFISEEFKSMEAKTDSRVQVALTDVSKSTVDVLDAGCKAKGISRTEYVRQAINNHQSSTTNEC